MQFLPGDNAEALGLTGKEHFSISGLSKNLQAGKDMTVVAQPDKGDEISFSVTARLDSPVEVEYYRNGGILQTVLRNLLEDEPA